MGWIELQREQESIQRRSRSSKSTDSIERQQHWAWWYQLKHPLTGTQICPNLDWKIPEWQGHLRFSWPARNVIDIANDWTICNLIKEVRKFGSLLSMFSYNFLAVFILHYPCICVVFVLYFWCICIVFQMYLFGITGVFGLYLRWFFCIAGVFVLYFECIYLIFLAYLGCSWFACYMMFWQENV